MAMPLVGSTLLPRVTEAPKVEEIKEEHLMVVGTESKKKGDGDNALN